MPAHSLKNDKYSVPSSMFAMAGRQNRNDYRNSAAYSKICFGYEKSFFTNQWCKKHIKIMTRSFNYTISHSIIFGYIKNKKKTFCRKKKIFYPTSGTLNNTWPHKLNLFGKRISRMLATMTSSSHKMRIITRGVFWRRQQPIVVR